MNKLIVAIIVSHCFWGNILAQQLAVVSATERIRNYTIVGGAAPPRGKHYSETQILTTNYCIILSCKNSNFVVLDSICIDNIKERLIVDNDVNIDSLHHTYSIFISSFGRPCNVPANIPDHILYEYEGIKYTLLIKNRTVQYSKNTTHRC